jgi:hypothetical protein
VYGRDLLVERCDVRHCERHFRFLLRRAQKRYCDSYCQAAVSEAALRNLTVTQIETITRMHWQEESHCDTFRKRLCIGMLLHATNVVHAEKLGRGYAIGFSRTFVIQNYARPWTDRTPCVKSRIWSLSYLKVVVMMQLACGARGAAFRARIAH